MERGRQDTERDSEAGKQREGGRETERVRADFTIMFMIFREKAFSLQLSSMILVEKLILISSFLSVVFFLIRNK